ncbi:polysaccharide deacetylase family protein [Nocardia sp. SYP-A9097]|uniref:polysaccharide deacetylase family protein n=1 Tax=Nocardia sp. SYP-A9097 TaxID=2663237 RepID=UPI00129A500B|nr:polysaccharide deacetylase family protein [Nocardia sp. SYP-A9097]MRH90772.1 polysaccharide deacetylase family protein [Nocardia sp. SYP-A9097]
MAKIVGLRVITAALLIFAPACAAPEHEATVPTARPVGATTPPPDPAAVGANELGVVPILMYHQLSPAPAGDYDQTPDKFRAELDRLLRENYRPITVSRYVSGTIDLPAGTHPVVLTFDDSTISQLTFTTEGNPAPDTAIAILEDFRARHPEFGSTATFFVNNEPFANDPRALPWLVAHGYEIGAHTATHANLARLDSTGVQREFVQNLRAIAAAVPNQPVRTMALPLGISPVDRTLATAGSWDGTPYTFDAVLLVGAEPAPSPYGALDPAAIPRIRSGRAPVPFDSVYWLDQLAEHPERRYTSDGDPARISFPRTLSGELTARWSPQSAPY